MMVGWQSMGGVKKAGCVVSVHLSVYRFIKQMLISLRHLPTGGITKKHELMFNQTY